ncbi:pilus assembly protein [Gilvimarinus sp. 1_MG-2023]|uniref:pilus assembly protein n=1 Tax=Gilvimarinus sp. 1_MG-2023 TaxID=3062638 RepID=UPI0026E40F77|nr:PilC/PilY family type IV pilus protein [Gilvimarinus sp. 1_MG-2023]MDO6748276.1 PilC/PilY family type IV pilus protein [Gilvimarinus sp. 1_MG-2023]
MHMIKSVTKMVKRPHWLIALVTGLMSLGSVHSVHAIQLAQMPLFLAQPVRPIVMLNMSNDHQLFFKAYDDYSDLDEDGVVDTTYKNDYDYYGYFDSEKCYSYSGGVFSVSGDASGHYCSGDWSGNFMNWATMTRMDAVRKILYGGKRKKDEATETVLERAFLPEDAHAFAKYYNGSDLNQLTPYSSASGKHVKEEERGLTLCNVTQAASGESQKITAAPSILVAKGNYSLWASNERHQCVIGEGNNGNDSSASGIFAHSSAPSAADKYTVRVKVCANGISATNNENCKEYDDGSLKPVGLLQTYGEDDSIWFGLMTGSYTKNKSGGALRKNVASMAEEVDEHGIFVEPDSGESIVKTLNSFRIARYKYDDGLYNSTDSCSWGKGSFNNGQCTNWGNPQSEIYLESLRYLAGKNAYGNFAADDSTIISGLGKIDWVDPITDDNYCAPTAVMQFNASTSSYDGDELGGFADIAQGETLSALTDHVGSEEGIHGGSYFVGESGGDTNQLCTAKKVDSLSAVAGTCPDAPRLEGSYAIAGLAYHARVNGVASGQETIQTFGIALAPAVPSVSIPVPNSSDKVTLLPACRNRTPNPDGNCAIVDFKVVEQNHSGGVHSGSLYVNWEDSEQGGDFDQDMWGMINYQVSSNKAAITTKVVAQSTGNPMGFGYVIAGTDKDGFHAHSGINNFTRNSDFTDGLTCGSDGIKCDCRTSGSTGACNSNDSDATTQVFNLEASSSAQLEQPLYYASRWGGFDTQDEAGNEVTSPPGDDAPTYFYATDPRELEESLESALETFAEAAGSASAVATNSTRLGTDSVAYQATFNTTSWSGDLIAAPLGEVGLGEVLWSASSLLPAADSRKIWTFNGSNAVKFEWGNLSGEQQAILDGTDGQGQARVDWTRGKEVKGFNEREPDQRLGDIVNSNPKYAGLENYGYARIEANGADKYQDFADGKSDRTVFVGANDGMLHAFDGLTGHERFAYIPSTVYEQLARRTDENYGSSFNPHKFSVDGQIFIGDAYINNQWRTILVGTLGAGGQGVFGLDVTDPGSFSEDNVLFEFNKDNAPEIGNVTTTPVVAPMPDGSWAVLLGNGYNSNDAKARLVVIPLDGNYDPKYIETGVGNDNGLSEPALSVGAGFLPNYAYAGDRKGNMYKFDLENLDLEYKLFESEDDQPITASPVLGLNPYRKFTDGTDGVMVYFGTGSYQTTGDLSDQALQSFYAIADTGALVGSNALFEKSIESEVGESRQVDEGDGPNGDEIDWETYEGWVLNFDTVAGERVVDKPILLYDRVIFPTVVPTDSPCDFGGNSWIMALIGVGGLYSSYSPFADGEDDTNPEEGIKSDNLTELGEPIDGGPEGDDPVPCDGGTFIIQQNSDGTVEFICTGEPSVTRGRQSWRQVQ